MLPYTERELADRVIGLKIQLAVVLEKLIEKGQRNFASHLYLNLSKMYLELDRICNAKDSKALPGRMGIVLEYLTEVENILLACKIGVDMPAGEKVLNSVRELKIEMKRLVTAREFSEN